MYYAEIAVSLKAQQKWTDTGKTLQVHTVHKQDSCEDETNLKSHNADHRSKKRPRPDVNRPWNGVETENQLSSSTHQLGSSII